MVEEDQMTWKQRLRSYWAGFDFFYDGPILALIILIVFTVINALVLNVFFPELAIQALIPGGTNPDER